MIKQKFSFSFSLFIIVFLIIGISIIALYSASYNKSIYKDIYLVQFLWFVVGLVLMLIVNSLDIKKIYNYSLHVYLLAAVLLILTLFFGKDIRFTRAWISIGSVNFQFSEIAKITTVLFLAKYIDYHYREFIKFTDFIAPFLIILFPVLLILLQPDVGSTFVYFPAFFVMVYLAEADLKYMGYFIIIGIVSFVLPLAISYYEIMGDVSNMLWIKFLTDKSLFFSMILIFFLIMLFLKIAYKFYPKYKFMNIISNILLIILVSLLFSHIINNKLKPYQKKRLLVFLVPEIDPYGSGYNIIQSKITIGSGQFVGKGYLKGSQTQLGFLPEQTTDFIISVIGEEFGWIGMSLVLLLYLLFILNLLKIVYNAKEKYSSLVGAGITAMFMFQIFVNLGMCLGIMPITGIPLPLLSYGGSSLVSSMISIGILNSIKNTR